MSALFKKVIATLAAFLFSPAVVYVFAAVPDPNLHAELAGLPVVGFGALLTFFIRMIFVIAGLAALIYGLLGGISWITSGGEKEKIQAARDKIQAAIVGIFVLIVVLTVIWTLEQLVFNRTLCFGISCDVTIPNLTTDALSPTSCYGYCAITDNSDVTVPPFNPVKYRGGKCDPDVSCPDIGSTKRKYVSGGDRFCNRTEPPPLEFCCCTK